MSKQPRYSPEVRSRAVRMVFEHRGEHASEWAAISWIASKIACKSETLRVSIRQAERDQSVRVPPRGPWRRSLTARRAAVKRAS